MEILIFIVVLSVLVLVHELGHFLVAKFFGVKVEEFGFGFPPKIFGIKKGETLYSINLLPIGGFVKLYGEDEAGGGKITATRRITGTHIPDFHRTFIGRPVWQRFLIVIAGVVMNFLLAVLLISYLFGVAGVSAPGDKVIITEVAKGSPAEVAGLAPNQQILEINGKKIVSSGQLISTTRQNLGKEIVLKVLDKNSIRVVRAVPREHYPSGQGPLGVAITQNIVTKKYPWYIAPIAGTKESLSRSWLIASSLGSTVTQIAKEKTIPGGVAGPIGVAQLTGELVKFGPLAVLNLVSLISLNLAILNVLPIPALDGGRLFFIIVEGITRKKVSPKVEGYVHAAGMAVLLTLIALITFQDLARILAGKSLLPKP